MAYLRIGALRNSSVLRMYSERDAIQMNPDYQRMSGVWSLDNRQLLIDTILNDFDMPKLYFHEFLEGFRSGEGTYRYAVIDGRQRLESIWSFIDGVFPLSQDFKYYEDESVVAGGMTYADLGKNYPQLKNQLDSYTLPIMTVVTDDTELVEELFLRLNEAVPLNAAEKRNAIGGRMAEAIRILALHNLFARRIPFSNRRYQHNEVVAKCLLLASSDSIGDTKKAYLDALVRKFRGSEKMEEIQEISGRVTSTLDAMDRVFIERDPLLRAQAMVVIYFLVHREALDEGWIDRIQRVKLERFEQLRQKNRKLAEEDIAQASYALLEFDRMHLQGSNDRVSIEFRKATLLDFLRDTTKVLDLPDSLSN